MTAENMIEDVRRVVAEAVTQAMTGAPRSPWLDSEAAATYLGCTQGTLKTWRSRGEGPHYHVIQNKLVRYHVDDLDTFIRGEAAR